VWVIRGSEAIDNSSDKQTWIKGGITWQHRKPQAWKEMLTMLADGKNPPEIERATGIPKQTVNTHLRKYGRIEERSGQVMASVPMANLIFGVTA